MADEQRRGLRLAAGIRKGAQAEANIVAYVDTLIAAEREPLIALLREARSSISDKSGIAVEEEALLARIDAAIALPPSGVWADAADRLDTQKG